MLKLGLQLRAFKSTLKWNLLLIYGILILCTILFPWRFAYPFESFESWNVSRNLKIQHDVNHANPSASNLSLTFYDISRPFQADFKCIRTRTSPSTTVCLHSQWHDQYISHDLEDTGRWEPQVADDFLEALRRDDDVGVFDIGANIGYYTMLAAKMGHKVVAVEPLIDNIQRIHKAAQLENLCDRITVLQNAVAEERKLATIRKSGDNQGDTRIEMGVKPCQGSCPATVKTILLDDLVFVLPFERAVMKLDTQGYEHRAFQQAAQLFSRINITYVFMEWLLMKEFAIANEDRTADKTLVDDLIKFFFVRNYRPYGLSSDGGLPLDPTNWVHWPNDIVWHLLPDFNVKSKLLQRHFYHWPT